jgi:hypothetical protein
VSALAHPSGRPRRRRAALIVVAVLVAVLAVLLVIVAITGGRSAPQAPSRLVGKPAPGPLSDARHTPDPAAAGAARTFLAGYLAFIYGEGSVGQIRDASPSLIAVLGKAHPPRATGRPPRPRIVALGAEEASGSVLHLTALISDGVARYPIEIEIARGAGGWQATKLSNEE